MNTSNSARISPTAHYISWLKYRGGLSGPELTTQTGRLIHHATWPMMTIARLLGGVEPESVIVARHRALDHLLARAIEDGSISQVIEVAAGLSPRGREFVTRYAGRELTYVEGDLAGMCACKREALAGQGPLSRGHHIVELDVLLDAGPTSLAGVSERLLDPSRGTAVICEGLTPYLARSTLVGVWRRIARNLARHDRGWFVSDAYFPADIEALPLIKLMRGSFAALTRGRIHFAFDDIADVQAELERSGFARAEVYPLGELARELSFVGDPDNMPMHVFAAAVV
jgi:O-methyltransferase involved in polyketide biosynthesis